MSQIIFQNKIQMNLWLSSISLSCFSLQKGLNFIYSFVSGSCNRGKLPCIVKLGKLNVGKTH